MQIQSLSLIIFACFISYLIGSISGGIIVSKLKNIDIRNLGSKNAGGTNAFRTMGIFFAILVLLIDLSKGFIATQYIPVFFNFSDSNILIKTFCGIFAILGHVYPIFFKFNGGKGVGTALGVLLALFPYYYSLTLFSMWLLSLVISGYVGLSSIVAGLSFPISYYIYSCQINIGELIFVIFIPLLFIFTHFENIQRLINGSENQFKKIMILKFFKK